MLNTMLDGASRLGTENTARFCFRPHDNLRLHELYEQQRDSFWTPKEINFTDDIGEWDSLDEDTQRFLTFVLAFFSQADGIVIDNLMDNFQSETGEIKDAKHFYAIQNAIETIHNEVYSIMIDTYIRDPEKNAQARDAIQYFPSIRRISDWVLEWMDTRKPLLERIIGFACLEGIVFSGAFCAIYWIKIKHNKLIGLSKANEWIARDEALHTLFGFELYKHYVQQLGVDALTQLRIEEIVMSCMGVTEEFIRDALRVDLVGLKADDMVSYVKCTANYVSRGFGARDVYGVKNPFDWMYMIGVQNRTNFFEQFPTEYKKPTNNESFEISDNF